MKLTQKMKYFSPVHYLNCYATFRLRSLKKTDLYHYLELKPTVIMKEIILFQYSKLICLILCMEVFLLLFLFYCLVGYFLVVFFDSLDFCCCCFYCGGFIFFISAGGRGCCTFILYLFGVLWFFLVFFSLPLKGQEMKKSFGSMPYH